MTLSLWHVCFSTVCFTASDLLEGHPKLWHLAIDPVHLQKLGYALSRCGRPFASNSLFIVGASCSEYGSTLFSALCKWCRPFPTSVATCLEQTSKVAKIETLVC